MTLSADALRAAHLALEHARAAEDWLRPRTDHRSRAHYRLCQAINAMEEVISALSSPREETPPASPNLRARLTALRWTVDEDRAGYQQHWLEPSAIEAIVSALASPGEAQGQGRCATTLTERFANPDCTCPTYAGNLGPCRAHEVGANGRCVYCDHELTCHPAPATREDSLGLSIDMLDADRLREWARLITVHGCDIGHWSSVEYVTSKLLAIATGIEQAVRDIGQLRAVPAPPEAAPREATPPPDREEPRWVEFNMNHNVWVKLQKRGLDHLASHPSERRSRLETREGWTRWPLWELMNTFGHLMIMGPEPPFHTVIQFELEPPLLAAESSPVEPAAPRNEGWQPIETAPKDGTFIVFTKQGTVCVTRPHTFAGGNGWGYGLKTDPMVRLRHDAIKTECQKVVPGAIEIATHWMPLPAAPLSPAPPERQESETGEQ